MKNNLIYKTIYKQEGIQRRLQPIWWAVVGSLIGAFAAILLYMLPQCAAALSALLIALTAMGAVCIVCLMAFYTIGDKFKPYHLASRSTLEPREAYYQDTALDEIESAIANHDIEALERIKKSTSPQVVVITYSNADHSVCYVQVLQTKDGKIEPITNVKKL